MNVFKDVVLTIIGVVGSGIAYLLGGWDSAIMALLVCMGADYLAGLIVAGVFKKSGKSETGALNSRAGWLGLLRKCASILAVFVATQLDIVLKIDVVRNAVVIAFIANEGISIVENLGLMGIPFPDVFLQAIEVLKGKPKAKSEEERK